LAIAWLAWIYGMTDASSRRFGAAVSGICDLARPGAPAVRARFRVVAAEGEASELVGNEAEIRFRSPDQLRISTVLDGDEVHLGRHGETLWIAIPERGFAVEGAQSVPRFSRDPGRLANVEPAVSSPSRSGGQRGCWDGRRMARFSFCPGRTNCPRKSAWIGLGEASRWRSRS